MIQKQKIGDSTEIVVITDMVREGNFKKAVACIAKRDAVRGIKSSIRVYTV